ncbi:unnamed protein product [Blepharisma stoltei]|uniref:Uncharacterized protein n=1 Tax=Blepharisma stoltei TaxID=1481888 RepID=A0AAU9JGN3_9CILI|nr:unnamed protein product [Blepharisma stoltei]
MSFWGIFQNIFSRTTNSNINLKKDDDYELRRHLVVMKEIEKYKRYHIKSLSDSDIETIAESIYKLIKESGEIYPRTYMLYEELREIKKVLLLEDARIRRVLENLCRNTPEVGVDYKFDGLRKLQSFIDAAHYQANSGESISFVDEYV